MDWENYNYPPCLCVVHLDLEDCDEGGPRDAVKTALIAYWAGFVMCVLNAIITIVLAAGGVAHTQSMHQSVSPFYSINSKRL